jgi:hypothetical protein
MHYLYLSYPIFFLLSLTIPGEPYRPKRSLSSNILQQSGNAPFLSTLLPTPLSDGAIWHLSNHVGDALFPISVGISRFTSFSSIFMRKPAVYRVFIRGEILECTGCSFVEESWSVQGVHSWRNPGVYRVFIRGGILSTAYPYL